MDSFANSKYYNCKNYRYQKNWNNLQSSLKVINNSANQKSIQLPISGL